MDNQWNQLCTVSVLESVLSYSTIICTHSPTVSTPTSHLKYIIHQRFHIYFENYSFFLSLFCCTKTLRGETLSLSTVNVSEWGVRMCWLNGKLAEILIKCYMSLGSGSVSIAYRLHYSCSLCLILPLWCTVLFHKAASIESVHVYLHIFLASGSEATREEEWMGKEKKKTNGLLHWQCWGKGPDTLYLRMYITYERCLASYL